LSHQGGSVIPHKDKKRALNRDCIVYLMPDLVSILIPAYNCERWLADSVASALAQSWAHKEIIIVDDGSRDHTLAVARRFEGPAVKVVTQENAGAAAARNHAFSLAQGSYIQWLDADDLLSPEKITLQMAVAARVGPRVLLSSAWGYFRHRPRKARFHASPLWEDLDPVEWLTRKWEHNVHMQTATWLASRRLTEAAGPWDTRLLNDDDGEYFFRVIRACEGIAFVPNAQVMYRIVTGPRLSFIGRSDAKKEAQCLGMENQIHLLRRMADTPRVRAACVNYLRTWQQNFYPERLDLVERLRSVAMSLGGTLPPPSLGRKYDFIRSVGGWTTAKNVRHAYNCCKTNVLDRWDYFMHRIEQSNSIRAAQVGGPAERSS
jgi:glycosyltransferase involved in cell wall biosynthesis